MRSSTSNGFRETMWFKRGHTESEQSERAGDADAVDGDEDEPNATIAMLPVEDRYVDDGSITTEDSVAFSVRTGSTQHITTLRAGVEVEGPAGAGDVPVDTLMREMKRHGRRGMVAVGAGAAALVVMLVMYVI